MKKIINIAIMLLLVAAAQAQVGSRLKTNIDTAITNKTGAKSITPTGLGTQMKAMVDTLLKNDSLLSSKTDSNSYYIDPLVEHAIYTAVSGSAVRIGNTTWRTAATSNGIGRANRVLPSGKDGCYSVKFYSDKYGGIVLDTTTPTVSPNTFLIALVFYNGSVYFGLNNTYPSNMSATATYYRLRRTGSTWVAESSDDEKKWTVIYTYSFSFTGALHPYLFLENTPARAKMYEPKLWNFATTGCIIGNSTVAGYLGQSGVDAFMFNAQETATGFTANNIAVPGHTIAQQQATWQALTTAQKRSYQWVIVEIGLNDIIYTESAATAMARYQELIDTIRNQTSPPCKIILATMTPAKQRMIDLWGSTNGLISWQKWKDMNTSIMGGGSFPITKADYRFNQHTVLMENANGNLDTVYEVVGTYDHVHQNNAGRALQAFYYVKALQVLKLMPQRLEVKKPMTVVAALDFGNTSAQTSADLTVFVVGAALSDRVSIGVPNSAAAANTTYTAFVSAANTVTVRFHNYSSGSVNPSAGDFEVTIYK